MKSPEAQSNVASGLERSFNGNPKPASFLYHVGDVVYYMGEINRYFDQFYEPYEHYPAPIFAIPGIMTVLLVRRARALLKAFKGTSARLKVLTLKNPWILSVWPCASPTFTGVSLHL